MGRLLLWCVAIFVVGATVFVCVGAAWMAWTALSAVVSVSPDLGAWSSIYLFAGALTTSYLVVQLAPVSLVRVRKATADYPDRISKVYIGLWSIYHHLIAVALLAFPAAMAWPISLAMFTKWRRRRRAADQLSVEAADDEQTRLIRADIQRLRDGEATGQLD